MIVLVSNAWADAIAPGPPLCPPGFGRAIEGHAEVCAFDPMIAALHGAILGVVLLVVLGGVAVFLKKGPGS